MCCARLGSGSFVWRTWFFFRFFLLSVQSKHTTNGWRKREAKWNIIFQVILFFYSCVLFQCQGFRRQLNDDDYNWFSLHLISSISFVRSLPSHEKKLHIDVDWSLAGYFASPLRWIKKDRSLCCVLIEAEAVMLVAEPLRCFQWANRLTSIVDWICILLGFSDFLRNCWLEQKTRDVMIDGEARVLVETWSRQATIQKLSNTLASLVTSRYHEA